MPGYHYGGGIYAVTCNAAVEPAAAASTAAATLRQRNNGDGSGGDGSGGRHGPSRSRRNQLAMVSAIAEPPVFTPLPATTAGAATTSGRREPGTRRTPPLTIDEERVLLARIKDARLLRVCHEGLELAAAVAAGKGNGVDAVVGATVPVEAWAREAGLEVEDLSRALQEGIEAKRTLVERNMPMVINMVHGQYQWRLRGGQVSTADLVQEGAYALGLAADRFDPAMPNRFLTYALYIVRDKLDVALARGNSAISVPASALKELHRARRELADELGRRPSEAEMANFFANGVVVVDSSAAATKATASAATAASAAVAAFAEKDGISIIGGGGDGGSTVIERRAGRSRAVVGGEFSITAPSDDRAARQQARTRRRRLNLLSAVHKVTSIDRLIRASDGSTMIPLVDTLVGDDPPRTAGGDGDIAELLPRVLTPIQANLVRMACGLADGRPMSMAECSKELSLSVARTKSLFESSLEKLRIAATADNPGRLVRQP